MKQTVLVTGANGGIGASLCKVFSELEYYVIATDITSTENIGFYDEFIELDLLKLVNDDASRDVFFKEIREILLNKKFVSIINNAAIQIVKEVENIQSLDWQASFDINVIAPFILIKGLLPELKESKCASVVNISSIHASQTKEKFACYSTSKTALVGLTKSLAIELGESIRINAVCPAAVHTPMLIDGFNGDTSVVEKLQAIHPTKTIAKPLDIAKLVAFLVSSDSSFITGASINIDGGISSCLLDI